MLAVVPALEKAEVDGGIARALPRRAPFDRWPFVPLLLSLFSGRRTQKWQKIC